MNGCGRQWCKKCSEEMIHRDHRRGYESASALGQIVWREGPKNISAVDLDLATLKVLRGKERLLRLIEQKQPGHSMKWGQEEILRILDRALDHCKLCPDASELHIEQRSGVYIIRGHVAAAADSIRKQTSFDGPQVIERINDKKTWKIKSHEQFFKFLDPIDTRRKRTKVCEVCGGPQPDAQTDLHGRPDGWVHSECVEAEDN